MGRIKERAFSHKDASTKYPKRKDNEEENIQEKKDEGEIVRKCWRKRHKMMEKVNWGNQVEIFSMDLKPRWISESLCSVVSG